MTSELREVVLLFLIICGFVCGLVFFCVILAHRLAP